MHGEGKGGALEVARRCRSFREAERLTGVSGTALEICYPRARNSGTPTSAKVCTIPTSGFSCSTHGKTTTQPHAPSHSRPQAFCELCRCDSAMVA